MNKVKFNDKQLRSHFWKVFSIIVTLISFLITFIDIPKDCKLFTFGLTLVSLCLYYLFIYWRANNQKSTTLNFGESLVDVYFGDIFDAPEDDFKVISFNEYFDTEVGGPAQLISEKSINGQFLKKHQHKVSQFDTLIEQDQRLNDIRKLGANSYRLHGKKQRYQLGSVVALTDNYLAVAGSKFDQDDRATITMREYIGFLLTFWDEIDHIYNNHNVVIPVFGSGILRFTDGYQDATPQDLLEIILWSFKISRLKIAYPSRIKIVVFADQSNKYNLYKLKEITKNGL